MSRDFVPTHSDDDSRLSAVRIDEACDQFEAAWGAGATPRIEDYLDQADEPHRVPLFGELLALELELRTKRGDRPEREEYVQRFPAHAEIVRTIFGIEPRVKTRPTTQPQHDTGRNLLFGILGLQNNFISREALLSTFAAWVADKSRSLGQILRSQGALDDARHALLEMLLTEHLKLHGDDPDASLAALSSIALAHQALQHIRDPQLQASLSIVGTARAGGGRESPTLTSPRVVLCGIEPHEATAASAAIAGDAGRYRLLGEIARGGMGAVLKGRDDVLGRDVAVKVLLETHQDAPEIQRRFIEEAQIGGQLQHPGIVPVYELGTFQESRPFFAMKLVKGRTLAELFKTRSAATDDQPRFLAMFQQIAQTVSYAHARGVIHRDLKPSNVMVGSFGEVQVMDWGLAKVLPEPGAPVAAEPHAVSVIRTSQRQTPDDASKDGDVLGTPAYMSPEQADGDIAAIDRRADVFGLGSILCEILTGTPVYAGKTRAELFVMARRGDTADALARLTTNGVDADLSALARDCLSIAPAGRPADASIVTERITSYLDGVQVKLRVAERDRAVAEARAVEERHRRKLQAGLAASLLVLIVVVGLISGYQWQQHQARLTAESALLARLTTLRDQATARPEDPILWRTAWAAIDPVSTALGPAASRDARRRFTVLRDEIVAGERDRVLLDRLIDIRSIPRDDDPDGFTRVTQYTDAFHAAELDPLTLSPAAFATKLRARPASTTAAILAGLDAWMSLRSTPLTIARTLADAARAADPDPWRNEIRLVQFEADHNLRLARLQKLAEVDLDTLVAVNLHRLGTLLWKAGDEERAESILRTAQLRFPRDLWINFDLGTMLLSRHQRDEAIRFYSIARSLRPETAQSLARALADRGAFDEAQAVLRDLVRLRPGNAEHWLSLGDLLKKQGHPESTAVLERAIRLLRDAIRLKPDLADAYSYLGYALNDQGEYDEAVAVLREAIRLKPDQAVAHSYLGAALNSQGKPDEALAACRTAIQLEPKVALTHNNLGIVLNSQGKFDEAVAAYRAAIRLEPADAVAHSNLGVALNNQSKFDEAVAACREAIRLEPKFAMAYYNLGIALYNQSKFDEAVAALRGAIRLKPDLADAYSYLGAALNDQGKHDEAVAACREAILLKPDDAMAHCNLGNALRQLHDYPGALTELRRGHELGTKRPDWRLPSSQWVDQAERLLKLDKRLPAVLKGDDRPRDTSETLTFGQMCYDRGWHAAAARLWADALMNDLDLGKDRRPQVGYKAACSAALAGCGKGKDETKLDEQERKKLRMQALAWLKAERDAWEKVIESAKPQERTVVVPTLQHWRRDAALAFVRDRETLKALPDEEQKAWREFWESVDVLIKKAS